MLPNARPPITAPIDNPTFAIISSAISVKRLLSIRLVVSSANEDMVVNEPQKPTAVNSTYWESKFKATERIENSPKMKLPTALTTKTFTGKPYRVVGDSTSLYRRNAPATAPNAKRANSTHFKHFTLHLIW